MKIFRIIFWLILFVASALKPAEAKLFDAEEFYLKNGLRVILIPNHKAPIVRQMVWYRVGGVDELPGQGGTAHLLEHLMFRGTDKISGEEYNRLTQVNGMDGNAFTSRDFTVYHQSMDISRLEMAMFLEADRMKNLRLDPQSFGLERDIVFQERKQVVENNPAAPFYESMQQLRWQEHPYSKPVTGSPEEIMNLSLDGVQSFYKRYYAPNNAILVLSGDLDLPTAMKLAEKYFGSLPKSDLKNRVKFPEMKADYAADLKMELPGINNLRLSNNWIVPGISSRDQDVYALILLSKYLGGGETSKLYKDLVRNKKLALAVDASYDEQGRSYGSFSISALPAEGVSASKLQDALDQALQEAIAAINLSEIESTKQKLLAGLVYLRDNPNDAAMIVGQMAASGMSLNDIEAYADTISEVEYQDVKAAAQKFLRPQSRVNGYLMPISEGK